MHTISIKHSFEHSNYSILRNELSSRVHVADTINPAHTVTLLLLKTRHCSEGKLKLEYLFAKLKLRLTFY